MTDVLDDIVWGTVPKFRVGQRVLFTNQIGAKSFHTVLEVIEHPDEYKGVMPILYRLDNDKVEKEFYLDEVEKMAPDDIREDREQPDRDSYAAYERDQQVMAVFPEQAETARAIMAGKPTPDEVKYPVSKHITHLGAISALVGIAMAGLPDGGYLPSIRWRPNEYQSEASRLAAIDRAEGKRARRNARNLKNKANGG